MIDTLLDDSFFVIVFKVKSQTNLMEKKDYSYLWAFKVI